MKIYKLSLLAAILFSSLNVFSADYYWVNDSGNWSDFANHWATTSGGTTFHTNIPGLTDRVFIDANSFTTVNQSIEIDTNANCYSLSINANGTLNQSDTLVVQNTFNFTKGTYNSNGYLTTVGNFYSDSYFSRKFYIDSSDFYITNADSAWYLTTSLFQSNFTDSRLLFSYSGADTVDFYAGDTLVKYKRIDFNNQKVQFFSTTKVDSLYFTDGTSLWLPENISKELYTNYIQLNGVCGQPAFLSSLANNAQAIIDLQGNSWSPDFIRIKNSQANNGTFTATNSIDVGNNSGWTINEKAGGTVYWIGGTGNWSDSTHWSTNCIPGPNDTVVFNAASFTATNQYVNVDMEAYCHNMEWTSVANTPDLQGSEYPIIIRGSVIFDSGMTASFNNKFIFTSSNASGESITTNGVVFNAEFVFNNTAGVWTMADDFTSNSGIRFNAGQFTGTPQTFNLDYFISNTDSTRNINFNSSDITLTGVDSTWVVQSTNLTLDVSASLITVDHNLAGYSLVIGGGEAYNRMNFYNTSSMLFNDNSFNIMEVAPGSSLAIESGSTQSLDSLIAIGSCDNFVQIESNNNLGAQAIIEKTGYDTLIIDYTNLINIEGLVSASEYYVAQNANYTQNTVNWDTTALGGGANFYWVGGSGNWNDISHWQSPLTVPASCLPTIKDSVHFHLASFTSTGDTVYINVPAYSAKMDWTGSEIWSPVMDMKEHLHATHEITFNSTMEVVNENNNVQIRAIPNGNNFDFNTADVDINANLLFSAANITDTLFTNGNLLISENNSIVNQLGHIESLSDTITAGFITVLGSNPQEINLNTTQLLVKYSINFNELDALDAGTSNIHLYGSSSSDYFYANDFTYYDVEISSETSDTATFLTGSNTFNNLTFNPGLKIRIEGGENQTINGHFYAEGNCTDSIFVLSTVNGTSTDLTTSFTDSVFCVSSSDIDVNGSTLNAFFSSDNSNNTGSWAFNSAAAATALYNTPLDYCLGDTTVFANLSTSFTGGLNTLTYSWTFGDDSTSTSAADTVYHHYTEAGKYYARLTATYSNECSHTYLDSVRVNDATVTFTTTSFDTTVCHLEEVDFNAISNPVPDSFIYYVNGTAIDTNTTGTYTTSALVDADTIQLQVTLNGCTFDSDNEYIFQVNDLPSLTFTSSDSDNTTCSGDSLTVTVSGASTYKFYLNSTAQTLYTTDSTFTTTSLVTNDTLWVLGKNTSTGCINSADTTFIFTVNPYPTPTFTSSDADNVICDGDLVTFTAGGAETYAYLVDGDTLSGFTTTTTFSTDSLTNGQLVQLIADTLGCSTLASSSFDFTVYNNPTPVLSSSVGNTLCDGETTNLSATGASLYSFYLNGTLVQGPGLNPNYNALTPSNADSVYVIGNSNGCTDTSSFIHFVVNAVPTVSLSCSDADTSICQNSSISFTASGASSYLFSINGQAIGSYSATNFYTTDSLTNGQIVTVSGQTGGCSASSSQSYTVEVLPEFSVNLNTTDSDSLLCHGETIDFNAITAAGTYTYNLYNGSTIIATNTSGNFSGTTLADGTSNIHLSATKNGCTYFSSDTIPVTQYANPVATLSCSDADTTICSGEYVTFTAGGGSEYTYIYNGSSLSTSATNTFNSSALENGDEISVMAHQNGCSSQAGTFTMEVISIPSIGLTLDDIDHNICDGGSITATASGADNFEFFVNNSSTGASSAVNTYSTTFNADAEIYVVGTTSICSLNSDTIAVTVHPNPTINLSSSDADQIICEGEQVTFTSSGASTYELLINGVGNGNIQSQVDFDVDTLANGDVVTVEGYSAEGCYALSSDNYTFTVNAIPSVSLNSSDADNEICVGDNITFTPSGATSYDFYLDDSFVTTGATYITDSLSYGQTVYAIGNQNGCLGTSDVANFIVYTYPNTFIATTDTDTTICEGDDFTIIGLGALDYEFTVNGSTVFGPSTTDTLTLNTFVDGDNIEVIGYNHGCATTSSTMTIQVNSYPIVNLVSSDLDNEICYGETVNFTASGADTYEFIISGLSQNSASSNQILNTDLLEDNDSIWVIGYNGDCPANSLDTIVMTVNTMTLELSTSSNGMLCPTESVTYNGSGADEYEFYVDGTLVQGPSTQSDFTTSTLTNGQVVSLIGISNSTLCHQEANMDFMVNQLNTPNLWALNDTDICQGDSTLLVTDSPYWIQWYADNVVIPNETDTFYTAYNEASYQVSATLGGQNEVLSVGLNSQGQIGNSSTLNEIFPHPTNEITTEITQVESGKSFAAAVDVNGDLYLWGDNSFGQLGNGTFTDELSPYISSMSNVSDVSCGDQHTVIVTQSGEVYSWGQNSNGQLGQGNLNHATFPFQVTGLTNVVQVEAGEGHSMALTADGEVYTWGKNTDGQLGIGNYTNQTTPQLISGLSQIQSIHCGSNHSMAIDSTGHLYVWGNNNNGQLGLNDNISYSTPQLSPLNHVKTSDGGNSHTIVLLNNGQLYAMGDSDEGQLGLGNNTAYNTPTLMTSLDGVDTIFAGYNQSFAVRNDMTVWAWGKNNYAQLGNENTNNLLSPTFISNYSGTTQLSVGEFHTELLAGESKECLSAAIQVNVFATSAVTVTENGGILSSDVSGNAYQWYVDGILIPGANSQSFIPNQAGYYSVEVTFAGGCSEISDEYPFEITGINLSELQALQLVPNPSKGTFIIQGVDKAESIKSISISNAAGQVIYQSNGIEANQPIVLDVANGLYIVNVMFKDGSWQNKKLQITQ